jgi:hypothetical protein
MIVWLIVFGLLFLLLTLPARAFGWLCGKVVGALLRGERKPPLPSPIDPR